MKKYDIEKEQPVIDKMIHSFTAENILCIIFTGLAYLGFDLKLKYFTGFFAMCNFLLFIWIICEVVIIGIHYGIKHKREKEKVGVYNENK